jgi:hypothetical protein
MCFAPVASLLPLQRCDDRYCTVPSLDD